MTATFLIFLPTAPGHHFSTFLALGGKDYTGNKTLQRFTIATLEHGMRPPVAPKSEWRELMDEMVVVATKEYRSIVFQNAFFNKLLKQYPNLLSASAKKIEEITDKLQQQVAVAAEDVTQKLANELVIDPVQKLKNGFRNFKSHAT